MWGLSSCLYCYIWGITYVMDLFKTFKLWKHIRCLLKKASTAFLDLYSRAHGTLCPEWAGQYLLSSPRGDMTCSTAEVPKQQSPFLSGSTTKRTPLVRPRRNLSSWQKYKWVFGGTVAELCTHLRRSLFLDPDLERRGELSKRRYDITSGFLIKHLIHPGSSLQEDNNTPSNMSVYKSLP